MDPFTVAGTCVGLVVGITTLLERIRSFAREVRSARKDMDAASRELISLQLSVEAIRDERQTRALPGNI